jgi:SOS response regulatory protein OraA/RecX
VVNWPFKVIQGGAQHLAPEAHPGADLGGAQTPSPQPTPDKPASKVTAVKARAVSLLAQREYSRQELTDKLAEQDVSPEELALRLQLRVQRLGAMRESAARLCKGADILDAAEVKP